jgi:integrase/recombinase XerD
VNLVAAVETYVKRKRAEGLTYGSSVSYLVALGKLLGNVPLESITPREVLTFLDSPRASSGTWIAKYRLLQGFFDFWLARHEIDALPMPVKRNISQHSFIRHVYTQTEIRNLLKAVRGCQQADRCGIDPATFRAFLIFIYGTGVMVGEALRLLIEDVDLKKGFVTIHRNRHKRSRTIPICSDLINVLKISSVRRRQQETAEQHFFLNKRGEALNSSAVERTFKRLRRFSGTRRHDDADIQPRMYDLRHTFAVHRIAGWIKHGADLNRMLPALAAYMGLADLRSIERYLSLTPERFRTQLSKLSPQRGKKRWRDDPKLMKFLSQLSGDQDHSRSSGSSMPNNKQIASPAKTARKQSARRNDV